MNEEWLSRTRLLMGDAAMERLQRAHVMVVGVGGVGAYAAEMIARAGVGRMTIVDGDTVAESNLNRQLVALHSTLGRPKTEVMAERLLDINPELQLTAEQRFLEADDIPALLEREPVDFVVDAIDTLAPKIALITYCLRHKVRIASSMGAGGRKDPSAIRLADIADTYHCGLARAVRLRLRKAGITKGLKTVFSTEQADPHAVIAVEGERNKKSTVGTLSYLPALFGCHLASYVIRKLTES